MPFSQDASWGLINAGNSPGGAFLLNTFPAACCVNGMMFLYTYGFVDVIGLLSTVVTAVALSTPAFDTTILK